MKIVFGNQLTPALHRPLETTQQNLPIDRQSNGGPMVLFLPMKTHSYTLDAREQANHAESARAGCENLRPSHPYEVTIAGEYMQCDALTDDQVDAVKAYLEKKHDVQLSKDNSVTPEQARYAYDAALNEPDPLDMAEEGPWRANACDSSPVSRSTHRTDEQHAAYVRYLQQMASLQNAAPFSSLANSIGYQPQNTYVTGIRYEPEHNHILDEATGKWRCFGPFKHRWIHSDGTPRREPACL